MWTPVKLALIGLLLSIPISAFAQSANTSFNPAIHSFRFNNTFENMWSSEFGARSDGLCGGMVYAAMDYFNSGTPVPSLDYEAAYGTTMRSYLEARHRDANHHADIVGRGFETYVDFFGWRNTEFFNWGLEVKSGGQLQKLRDLIDSGVPVPIALPTCEADCSGGHWALAIGYDMGRYEGGLGDFKSDLVIKVYDPNNRGVTSNLRVDPEREFFFILNNESDPSRGRRQWRTYYVSTSYKPESPPDISADPVTALRVDFATGRDNLRSDTSVSLIVRTASGGEVTFDDLNRGYEWIGTSDQTVVVPWNNTIPFSEIVSAQVQIVAGSGKAGEGSDNWDLNGLKIVGLSPGGNAGIETLILDLSGGPLERLSGSLNRTRVFQANRPATETLSVYLETGSDDLRGGDDNLNLTVLLQTGAELNFANINRSTAWSSGQGKIVSIPLPVGTIPSAISAIRLSTTSGGGLGGDNWDLRKLCATVGPQSVMFYVGSPAHRFTGGDPAHRFSANQVSCS